MLLPSPFPCDSAAPRPQTALFASPPASPPPLSAQQAIGNLFTTCRSLQSLLATSSALPARSIATAPITPPTSSHAQIPTPPMAHAPAPPPLKLRLRPRKTEASAAPLPDRQRIAKRATATARGTKRRRRAPDEGAGRQESDPHDVESDLENPEDGAAGARENVVADEQQPLLTTPKRARIAPEVLPLGLERGDYHALHGPRAGQNDKSVEGIEQAENRDGEAAWTAEDDRILVELVLEKLKLSKLDWQECARSLGKDRGSVGRRWKSLMVNGDIGLKRSSGRSNIHGTWR